MLIIKWIIWDKSHKMVKFFLHVYCIINKTDYLATSTILILIIVKYTINLTTQIYKTFLWSLSEYNKWSEKDLQRLMNTMQKMINKDTKVQIKILNNE